MSQVIASTYEIIKEIGAGGGGVVYLAYHQRLNKKVVLKADKRGTAARLASLRREVDVLKELRHKYIPQVYDFFVHEGTVYTVIDYVEGESLDKPLKRGERFSQPQVIHWAVQLLEALCYLHSPTHGDPPRGFVHGDIKPANIMRTTGDNICLIDFNIALAWGRRRYCRRRFKNRSFLALLQRRYHYLAGCDSSREHLHFPDISESCLTVTGPVRENFRTVRLPAFHASL